MRSRALGIVLMWGVAIGCGSSGPSEGTGGSGGSSNGGHGGKGTGGSATGGHTGGSTGTGGTATGGNAGGTGGQAGNGSLGGATGQGGSGGGTGGVAGGGGGHPGGGAGGGVAGSAGGGNGGSAGGGGGVAGSAGGANGGSAGGGVAGSAGGAAGGAAGHTGGAGGAGGSAGGAAGSAGGAAGGAAGHTGGAGGGSAGGAAGGAAGAAGGAGGANAAVVRGQYLVNNVLTCTGCHGSDLAGKSCFVGSTTGTDCLSSANLTNSAVGLASLSDQQIKDAFTQGKDPDVANRYLFSRMPYYQFANLSDSDANAIVAYLRTVPGVTNSLHANTGAYAEANQPTSPEWQSVALTDLPDAAGNPSGATNGKYLAALVCVTCHTVNATVGTGNPSHIDTAKAYLGGKAPNGSTIQSSNLTPSSTGIMGWSAADILTVIKLGVTPSSGMTCGNMSTWANMTNSDANDIGTYLTHIPAVANATTSTCP